MTFGALMKDFQNGFASGERDNNGIIQLRMNNVNSTGQMIMNEYIRVPKKYYSSKYDIKEGDILFNHTNSAEMVGKSFVFKGYNEPVTFSNHFSRIRVDKSIVNPNFIVLYLVYLFNQRFFERFCDRWIHQAAFQKEKLLKLPVYFPNLVEQNHIVTTIETKLKSIEKTKQLLDQQLSYIHALPAAILRNVFNEEL
jgi:type I restriction enzyme S subunit